MAMRAAGPANQQPPVGGAPPNQIAQSGQAQAQGPILRLSNPGANPQLRSLLLSQQQPVRFAFSKSLQCERPCCKCVSSVSLVLAAGRGVPHDRHDVPPGFRAAVGPFGPRRGGSNAGPVEAALGRSASEPPPSQWWKAFM